MKNPETSFFVGYVEQGIGGGQDPLLPPVSVSANGTLAKWRGKFNFLDLRVNDPGLCKSKEAFSQMIQKADTLGIETVLTLPQYTPVFFDLPPEDPEKPLKIPGRKSQTKKPEKLVYFKPSYLVLSNTLAGSVSFNKLTFEDCLPVMELAAEYSVKNVVVPVSEPGHFFERTAEEEFCEIIAKLSEFAKKHEIDLHLRNGGLSERLFRRINEKYGCRLAYNVGIAHLESDNLIEVYNRFKDEIIIIALQQVLPGIDRWDSRRKVLESSLKQYVLAKKEFKQSLQDKDEAHGEFCLRRFRSAMRDYFDAFRNQDYNLGLFQNGDLNLVPLLKEIRKDLDEGKAKYLLLETVPNTKNTDFIFRYLLADSFSSSF
jgi:hypothetical protein